MGCERPAAHSHQKLTEVPQAYIDNDTYGECCEPARNFHVNMLI